MINVLLYNDQGHKDEYLSYNELILQLISLLIFLHLLILRQVFIQEFFPRQPFLLLILLYSLLEQNNLHSKFSILLIINQNLCFNLLPFLLHNLHHSNFWVHHCVYRIELFLILIYVHKFSNSIHLVDSQKYIMDITITVQVIKHNHIL